MGTINRVMAIKELQRFKLKSGARKVDVKLLDVDLDKLKTDKEILQEKKDTKNGMHDVLALICDGLVSIDDNGEITLKLTQPLDKLKIKELKFKNRVQARKQREKLSMFPSDDMHGMLLALTASRVDLDTGIVDSLDAMDYSNATTITGLF